MVEVAVEATALVGMADHPGLELLNSTADPGEVLDVLVDGAGLLRWLELTGLLADADAADLGGRFGAAALDGAAAGAREVREWLRPRVAAWAGPGGAGVDDGTVGRLNELLRRDVQHPALTRNGALVLGVAHRWSSAADLLALPAAAVADLLAHGDPLLVRHCEGVGCSLWFYDRTRSHQRRWCSMAVCGNRAKARAHRARHQHRAHPHHSVIS